MDQITMVLYPSDFASEQALAGIHDRFSEAINAGFAVIIDLTHIDQLPQAPIRNFFTALIEVYDEVMAAGQLSMIPADMPLCREINAIRTKGAGD